MTSSLCISLLVLPQLILGLPVDWLGRHLLQKSIARFWTPSFKEIMHPSGAHLQKVHRMFTTATIFQTSEKESTPLPVQIDVFTSLVDLLQMHTHIPLPDQRSMLHMWYLEESRTRADFNSFFLSTAGFISPNRNQHAGSQLQRLVRLFHLDLKPLVHRLEQEVDKIMLMPDPINDKDVDRVVRITADLEHHTPHAPQLFLEIKRYLIPFMDSVVAQIIYLSTILSPKITKIVCLALTRTLFWIRTKEIAVSEELKQNLLATNNLLLGDEINFRLNAIFNSYTRFFV